RRRRPPGGTRRPGALAVRRPGVAVVAAGLRGGQAPADRGADRTETGPRSPRRRLPEDHPERRRRHLLPVRRGWRPAGGAALARLPPDRAGGPATERRRDVRRVGPIRLGPADEPADLSRAHSFTLRSATSRSATFRVWALRGRALRDRAPRCPEPRCNGPGPAAVGPPDPVRAC